jgi:hypothetical protein
VIDSTFTAFFAAAAGASAGLIGLLFVALTFAAARPNLKDEYVAQETRAGAALLSFMNVLVASLAALIPGLNPGYAAVVIGLTGELYVAASVVALTDDAAAAGSVRERSAERAATSRSMLVVLATAFGLEVVFGALVLMRPHSRSDLGILAGVLVASLVIGISRTWEIVGVRDPGIRASLRLLRGRRR